MNHPVPGCRRGLPPLPHLAAVILLLILSAAAVRAAPPVVASPLDEYPLVLLQPGDWLDADGHRATGVTLDSDVAHRGAVPVAAALQARVRVQQAGAYTLWFRISQPPAAVPLKVTLYDMRGGSQRLEVTIAKGRGSAALGGPTGRQAYAKRAAANTPSGTAAHLDARPSLGGTGGGDGLGALDDLAELVEEVQAGTADQWVRLQRLDPDSGSRRFYWWKAGPVTLDPGDYVLRVAPDAAADLSRTTDAQPLLDVTFLTTYSDLVYPYYGDVAHPPATYVRFRLDELPPDGMRLELSFQTHNVMHHTLSAWCGSARLDSAMHVWTEPGWTPWYRLQDIEHFPAFPEPDDERIRRVEMTIFPRPAKGYPRLELEAGYGGVYQFATFPHRGRVVRELSMTDPTGLGCTVPLNVELHQHLLEPFRDAARRHYRHALEVVERPRPLARGPLYFLNSRGAAFNEHDGDYLGKTLRLLGFNTVSFSPDPVGSAERYGWWLTQGSARIEAHLPFDEEATRAFYAAEFENAFEAREEVFARTPARAFVDEPGEQGRTTMGAPAWRFRQVEGEDAWVDAVGQSSLVTRRRDLREAVLEGVIERVGRAIEFRAGVQDREMAQPYGAFRMGPQISPGFHNFGFGIVDPASERSTLSYRDSKRLGRVLGKIPFKLVMQGGRATLFIEGEAVATIDELPPAGGLAISGDAKRIYALRLRELRGDERISAASMGVGGPDAAVAASTAALGTLDPQSAPEWARPMPLEDLVETRFEPAGGWPGANEGFRQWLAEQGLTPGDFGKAAWSELTMITMPELVRDEHEALTFYWSRRYTGYLTPRMFKLAADAASAAMPEPPVLHSVALSGGYLTFGHALSMDMFELASQGYPMVPGVSDWIFLSTWRRDSLQQIAYSLALFQSGARRYGGAPASHPMMHCVSPDPFRSALVLAGGTRMISFYGFGPLYTNIGDSWSERYPSYYGTAHITHRAAAIDDILGSATVAPSRVALLYARSSEYWDAPSSFGDKVSTFLGLSHAYYQPDIVTEEQIDAGALAHYDALYVVEPWVKRQTQETIAAWVRKGGLLWAAANALRYDERNTACSLLADAGLERELPPLTLPVPVPDGTNWPAEGPVVRPADGQAWRAHAVVPHGMPRMVAWRPIEGAGPVTVRATYEDGSAAWLEAPVGRGRIVYIAHRAGLTYKAQRVQMPGFATVWASTGREALVAPLRERSVARPVVVSEPTVMVGRLDSPRGSAIVLHNMRATPVMDAIVEIAMDSRPLSASVFRGYELEPVAFAFEDGLVRVRLPVLDDTTQILTLRSAPAPADERPAAMRALAEQNLASANPLDRSAGIWLASFAGDAPSSATDLASTDWRVRRAAAEAIGRRGNSRAAEALQQHLGSERDPHVRAESLLALAGLHHPEVPALAATAATDADPVVRQEALEALSQYLSGKSDSDAPEDRQQAAGLAQAALRDGDQRVRRAAMQLLAQAAPALALASAIRASDFDRAVERLDRTAWAEVIASHPPLLTRYLEAGIPGSRDLLVEVASLVADPRLAAALAASIKASPEDFDRSFAGAAIRQADPDLARLLLSLYDDLPNTERDYVPLILQHSFGEPLGQNLNHWRAWLGNGNP